MVVTAPEDVRVARVVSRDRRTADDARARVAAQMPLEEKLRHATDVIDNGGSLEQTRAQVDALVARWR